MKAGGERGIGYVRVSSDQQAEGGVSLDAQREKLRAYAVAMDIELVSIIEDAGWSAKSLKRPGLQAALSMLEDGAASVMLITKLDRITRSVRDLGDLVDRFFSTRFALLSVGDSIDTRSASGRLVLNVLTSVAQWEREAGAERTREALAHVKRDGGRIGRAAFGWQRGTDVDASGRLVVSAVAEEGATICRMIELRAKGYSLSAIARAISDEGRQTKRGGRWSPETVRRVLGRAAAQSNPVAS